MKDVLNGIIEERTSAEQFARGVENELAVSALKQALQILGYKSSSYEGSNVLDDRLMNLVRFLGQTNNLETFSDYIPQNYIERIVELLDYNLPYRILKHHITQGNTEGAIYRSTKYREGVLALQKMINFYTGENVLVVDGDYGNGTKRVLNNFIEQNTELFESIEGLNGEVLCTPLAKMLVDNYEQFLGEHEVEPSFFSLIQEERKKYTQNGSVYMNATNKNLSNSFSIIENDTNKLSYVGHYKVKQFINDNQEFLRSIGVSDSSQKIFIGIAEVEGNFDALNTWDWAFISFGFFQWTIGVKDHKGELASLLWNLKKIYPSTFSDLFAQYGLDVFDDDISDNTAKGPMSEGFVSLDGKIIKTAADKEATFRNPKWAFILWQAGQHSEVQIAQLLQAKNRIDYVVDITVRGHKLSNIMSSEYGMALMLEHHVNSPNTIDEVISRTIDHFGLIDPDSWATEHELNFIAKYIEIRREQSSNSTIGNYKGRYIYLNPTTGVDTRAEHISSKMDSVLSTERGSFVLSVF